MITSNSSKVAQKYYCEYCDYTCSKSSDFKKHVLTLKHKNNDVSLQNDAADSQKVAAKSKNSCECGKKYKYRQGLYYHRKMCEKPGPISSQTPEQDPATNSTSIVTCIDQADDEFIKKMMMEMMKYNYDLQSKMIEMCSKGDNNHHNNTNTNNNHSHNKTFNLQFFLNETCKDAMNLSDFINSIQLQLSDVEKVGKLGYVKGISDIIIQNLNQLDITMRPVHCSDQKRETVYVKEGDQWYNESNDTPENQKLKSAIKKLANKNISMISAWKTKYPDCIFYESKKSDIYNHIMYESMDMNDQNHDKIIKNIAKCVVIDKSLHLT